MVINVGFLAQFAFSFLETSGNFSDGFEIQLPQVNGGIKVYAMVNDTFNNVGIATTSISIIDKRAAKRKFLLPKAALPFYIYQDNENLPYVLSAYMGDYEAIKVDLNNTATVKTGETAIKIEFKCESRAKSQFSSVIKIKAAAIRPKIWTISPGNDRTLLAL